MRRSLITLLACGALAAGACAGGDTANPAAPFPGAARSLTELGQQGLEALTAGDTAVLARLRLTESEHNDSVYPALPAASARPTPFPVDLAWENISVRNRAALEDLLSAYAGRRLRYTGTHCTGGVQGFGRFVVHTGCQVFFQEPGGRRLRAQLFKDAVEWNGGLKVFRWYGEPAVVLESRHPAGGSASGQLP